MPLRFVSFLLLPLCMLLSPDPRSAHAQMKVGFGAKVGANFGLVGGDMETMMLNASVFGDDVKENPRTGIVAGGFAVIDFGGGFSIQPEVSYVQKGQTVEFTPLPPPGQSRLEVSRFTRVSEPAKMSLRFS